MRSAGRSEFVRVLPWVLCLALGAAAHLVWALHAWWSPPEAPAPVVVQVTAPTPSPAPATTIIVHEHPPAVRRTESAAASDPELVRMLIDAHVRCDGDAACTIDPRLVDYLMADPRRRGQLVLDYAHDGEPRTLKVRLRRIEPPTARRHRRAHRTGSRTTDGLDGTPRARAISASP